MAATRIADVVVPEVFTQYMMERTAIKSAMVQSGIIQTVPDLDINASSGGNTINIPFWQDLSGDAEELSDTTPLTVNKIDSEQDIAVLHALGKAWGSNDLARAFSGDDPMAAIADLIADWWARVMQARVLASLQGVFAAASMSGNVSDISATAGAGQISAATLLDAMYTLGDAIDSIEAIIMHSAAMAVLAKEDQVEYLRNSESQAMFPTYLGKRIIVDDTMPVDSGTYTTYLFGQGAIGFVDGAPPVPTETDRDTLQGDDILVNRRHMILHPRGVKWVGTPAGASPTKTELQTGTNWTRVYENKNIRIVQFKHKLVANP